MKNSVLGTLFIGLVACSSSEKPRIIVDAFADGSSCHCSCNLLMQTGCNAGEMCTWINDQDNPPVGHVGCAPAGTVPLGSACTEGPAGPMGYDNCAKGSVCVAGQCKQICDHQGGAPMCDSNHACTRYADVFVSGAITVAGVCDPACDPLTQDLKIGTAPATIACGSPMAAAPSKGCYGYDEFSCAPVSADTLTLTDRMEPRTNSSGNPYLNGCAPGFIPLFFEGTGSMKTLCTGFCSALEVNSTAPGGVDGDATALGKLPGDSMPVANKATCAVGVKGSLTSSECKFMWPFLVENNMLPPHFESGPLLDTLGVCMAVTQFQYDKDMNPATGTNGNEENYPSCVDRPAPTAATTGDDDDSADWFCAKVSSLPAFTSSEKKLPRVGNPTMRDFRIPKQAEMEIVRHTIQQ